MHAPPEKKIHRLPAPCHGARRLLTIAAAASLLLLLAIAADQLLRPPRTKTSSGTWMKAITLSSPALWTAGSPMRHPETVHPGVDLRHAAGLVSAQ
jgi:hypothetical protein